MTNKKTVLCRIDKELMEFLKDFSLELSIKHRRKYSIRAASKILAIELKRKPILEMLKEFERESKPIEIKSFMKI